MNEIEVKMNKPVYLGLSPLDISKIAMYEYCVTMQNQYVWSMESRMCKAELIRHPKILI